jgi:hypothetical protein
MDLAPPLGDRRGLPALFQRWPGGRSAGAVRGDFFQDGFAQAVPQVPAVTRLHRAGQHAADGL